jgi:hypothetical protein
MENAIKLFYSTELLRLNTLFWISWAYTVHPNLVILGNTGSGKSVLIRLIAAKSAMIEGSRLWVCCYKNELLSSSAPRFWGYTDVMKGLEDFKTHFEKRLTGEDKSNSFCLLIIDEYPAWLASMSKSDSEKARKSIAELCFMVRSKNMHILLGCQRAMATDHFTYGARDCLNPIFLGSPSKESLYSFMSAEQAKVIKSCGRGAGYMAFDGLPIKAVTVPIVRNFERLEQAIIDG